MTAIIRTVLGDIEPETAGVTYCHEHVVLDSPTIELKFPHILLNDPDAAVRELLDCRASGVSTIVDAMPMSAGRDINTLAAISRESNVHIVSATGLHHDRYYGSKHWTNHADVEELADLFVADIVEGIDRFDYTGPVVRRTSHKAGILKVATSGRTFDERDRRILAAIARAHHRTGAPILTHCEDGEGGVEQVRELEELGVNARRIILSHVDKNATLERIDGLLETGAYLEFDQCLRQQPDETAPSLALIAHVVAAGGADRLVLGTDGARKSLWRVHGGDRGLAWLFTGYSQLLDAVGVDAQTRRRLFVLNPQQALAMDMS